LVLGNTGGSNGYRCRAWKTELQTQLADAFGFTLTVAHYPTGASKWNPIEHWLFSEISKNWAGEPLDSYQKILRFIRSTRTQSGLSVTAHLDRRHYPTGVEPAPEQLQALRLQPGEILPKWNYTISPHLRICFCASPKDLNSHLIIGTSGISFWVWSCWARFSGTRTEKTSKALIDIELFKIRDFSTATTSTLMEAAVLGIKALGADAWAEGHEVRRRRGRRSLRVA
jgi:hypothetical protein